MVVVLTLSVTVNAGAAAVEPEAAGAATGNPAVLESPEKARLKVGPEGIALFSGDAQFKLRLRGYLQADARFFPADEAEAAADTFVLRRVRPILEGTVFGRFDFRIMPDFGGGKATLFDAHLDARLVGGLRVRVGKFKPPVGLERLQSGTSLVFLERAFPTLLVPNRDLGLQLDGEQLRGRVTWAAGVFAGASNGANVDGDTDDGKDLAARVFVKPLKGSGLKSLAGLGVGVSGSWGRHTGKPDATGLSSMTTSGQQVFFRYRSGSAPEATAIADGALARISPQAYYQVGPFGLLAEFVHVWERAKLGSRRERLEHLAWQVAPSFVIFGGEASFEGVKPTAPAGEGGAGALEVAGRFHQLRVDRDAFPVFADPAKSARLAQAWSAALNWYANSNVRIGVNYERTTFRGGAVNDGDRTPEDLVGARFQGAF